MRSVAAGVVIVALSSGALAQPAPAPPPPQPQQAAATLTTGAWYRFTLTDGRVVDAQLVGGDAQSYFIQDANGTFSLAHATVAAATPLQPPQSAPPPQVMHPPPPPPVAASLPPPEDGASKRAVAQGVGTFAGTYLFTALVAGKRRDEDSDAYLGFIPLIGPVLWTSTDNDKFLEDGWDWLALTSSLLQVGGVALAIISYKSAPDTAPRVSIAPVTRPGYGGIVFGGSF